MIFSPRSPNGDNPGTARQDKCALGAGVRGVFLKLFRDLDVLSGQTLRQAHELGHSLNFLARRLA
jgi:hypothetical protein